jgi:hypothetical protein
MAVVAVIGLIQGPPLPDGIGAAPRAASVAICNRAAAFRRMRMRGLRLDFIVPDAKRTVTEDDPFRRKPHEIAVARTNTDTPPRMASRGGAHMVATWHRSPTSTRDSA